MKSISSILQEKLTAGATTMCLCWRVERPDGVVLGFTEHDEDLKFEDVQYQAASGFSASTIEQSLGLSVDNQNLAGALSSNFITEKDINFGRYDNALITIYWVDWSDVDNRIKISEGTIGEVKRKLTSFEAEFRSIADKMNQKTGRIYQKTCDATLGDSRCGFIFKNFLGQSLSIDVNEKLAGAWDALRLFDEPEITDSPYRVQLLPWEKDGGLVGSDLRFQWPLTPGYSMRYGSAQGGAGVEVTQGDLGGYVGFIVTKLKKKKKVYYGYYGYTIEHYVKPPGDNVYYQGSYQIVDYNGQRAAQIGRIDGWANWYVLRSPSGEPVHTVLYSSGLAAAFAFTSVTGVANQTQTAHEALLSAVTNGTVRTLSQSLTINYTGPALSSLTIGGLNFTLNAGVATGNGAMTIKRGFGYNDVNNTGIAPKGIGFVFDVEFTLLTGQKANGEFALGWLKTDASTTYTFDAFDTNDGGTGNAAGDYFTTWPNVPWYDKALPGTAWTGNYEASPTSSPVTQIIPHGSSNIPANFPDMMMGKVFGFDLNNRRGYRLFLYATTDARYYIGSPGWHPVDSNDAFATVLDNARPRDTLTGPGSGSWSSDGWFQQSINKSRGPKMSELRLSYTGHWPDVLRYSDTAAMIDEATLDFNEAVRLAVDWIKTGQPISQAALNANMLATANDSSQLYLDYDLDIAKRTHTIPLSVPRTVADYNAWIDANAIANGSATASTIAFLRVPDRRANLNSTTADQLIAFLLTQPITGSTDIKTYDIQIVDQWVKGATANYNRQWTGPIRGKVFDLPNPLDYVAKLFVVSDAVYFIATVDLDVTGEFYFGSSGVGGKIISIRERVSDAILIDIKPGIGLLRSYRIPIPAPHPTLIYSEMGVGMQGLTSVDFVVNPGSVAYNVSYTGFNSTVSGSSLGGAPFTINMQFKRNGVVYSNLYNYYTAILYNNGVEIARTNINGAGAAVFSGIGVWGPTVSMKLFSRVPLEDDVVVWSVLKNRNFVYDQGVAIIAACCLGDEGYAERWMQGLLNALYIDDTTAPVDRLGVRTTDTKLIGNVSFSVDRYSGVPPDDYVRTGATAWVGTAIAFFLRTFPLNDLYAEAYDRLLLMMDNLDTNYLIRPGHPDYKRDGNPPNPGNDPNQYVLLPPLNGVTVDPVRNMMPGDYEDNRLNLYAGGLGAYVQAYQSYAPSYRIPWVAAEHNIDMYFLLFDCYKLTGDTKWLQKSKELFTAVVNVMWDDDQGRILQGCRAASKDYWTALDQHSWGACMLIAGGEPEKARRAMATYTPAFKWVVPPGQLGDGSAGYGPYVEGVGLPAGESTVFDGDQPKGINLYTDVGPDYTLASRAVWPEGTFGVVLAQLALGQKRKALQTYAEVTPLLNQFGYIYTTTPDLGYELQAWESVAGTGWAIVSARPSGFWEVYSPLDTTIPVFIEQSGPHSYVGIATAKDRRTVVITGTSSAQGQPGYYVGGWMAGGLFRVRSGPLEGWTSEIKNHYTDGISMVLELWSVPPNGPIAGESISVRAGCDKLAKTCYTKFSNFVNFQGFPFMPGNDTYGKYPNQTDTGMDGGSDNIGWEL